MCNDAAKSSVPNIASTLQHSKQSPGGKREEATVQRSVPQYYSVYMDTWEALSERNFDCVTISKYGLHTLYITQIK